MQEFIDNYWAIYSIVVIAAGLLSGFVRTTVFGIGVLIVLTIETLVSALEILNGVK